MKAKRGKGKPFTPGDKRINRKGRPRTGDTTAEVMRAKLDQVVKGSTRREIIAEAQVVKAEKGDTVAARLVIERAEGHALTPLSILGGGGRGPFDVPCTETDPAKLRVILANMRRVLARQGRDSVG